MSWWTGGWWASTVSSGGGGGGGADPVLYSGPVGYWDAAREVYTDTAMTQPAGHGDPVASWGDLSGNGLHLIRPDSEASARAFVDATAGALRFDGLDDGYTVTGPPLGPLRTLIAVLEYTDPLPPVSTEYVVSVGTVNTAGQRSGIARSASTRRFLNYDGVTSALWYDDQGQLPQYGRIYLVVLRIDPAFTNGLQPRVNGVIQVPSASIAHGGTDGQIGIGHNARTDGAEHKGRIYMAAVYDRALTDHEVADIEAHLMAEYGI